MWFSSELFKSLYETWSATSWSAPLKDSNGASRKTATLYDCYFVITNSVPTPPRSARQFLFLRYVINLMTIENKSAKQPTIYDVAVAAGVSKSLVSLVLNDRGNVSVAKKDAVLQAIDELGYRPSRFAQQLASSKTRSIGVVITDYKNLSYIGFLKGLREIFDDAGYQVIISDLHRSPNFSDDPVDAFASMKVDGLVMATEASGLRTHNLDIPVVMIGQRESVVAGSDMVFNDDEEGTRLILEHLYQLGHRKIAHLTGVGGIATNRRKAYEMSLRQGPADNRNRRLHGRQRNA
jgi:DNA-binding LacI/PurR family transcriptional regulator